MDPVVTMEVFSREAGVLCGIERGEDPAGARPRLAGPGGYVVEALDDGDRSTSRRSSSGSAPATGAFGLYETAILGMLAQSTGWATAARECVEAAGDIPVISFGARHVHPDVTDVLDYAAIVGGCVGRVHPGRRAPRRPQPDRHDAPLARPHLRRHRGRGARLRPRPRGRRPAHRPRRHVQGRGRGGAPGRPRARGPAVRRPARHPVGARPGDRGPRPRGPGAARPGGIPSTCGSSSPAA